MSEFEVLVNNEGKVVNKVFVGIDTNNIIASNVSFPYTATQDCYICIYMQFYYSPPRNIFIDEQTIIKSTMNSYLQTPLLLKKGQKVSLDGTIGSSTVYGIKY